MKSLILAAVLCFSASAMASSAAFDAETLTKNFDCQMKLNQAAMDLYAGMDVDGAAFTFSQDGKIQVVDSNRIVSRANNGNVETITYKTKELRIDSTGKSIFETVKRTVEVKREDGKVVSVNKLYDLNQQIANKKSFEKVCKDCTANYPLMKSAETTFAYDGRNGCAINQNVILQMKDEKAQVDAKVTYDKKFCESLNPIMKQMGAQNAAQCGGLLARAESYFNQRTAELKKEGKSFVEYNSYYTDQKKNNNTNGISTNFNIAAQIGMCASAESPVMIGAYGPMAMGTGMMMSGMASGMMMSGSVGGVMGVGAPAAVEKSKDASGVR